MKVKFLPQDVEYEIELNETVLRLAQRNDIHIQSVCKGLPSCAECRIQIKSGENNVPPPGAKELSLIGTAYYVDQSRLSCQLRCFGDVVIDLTQQIEKEARSREKPTVGPSGRTLAADRQSSAIKGSIIEEYKEEANLVSKVDPREERPGHDNFYDEPSKQKQNNQNQPRQNNQQKQNNQQNAQGRNNNNRNSQKNRGNNNRPSGSGNSSPAGNTGGSNSVSTPSRNNNKGGSTSQNATNNSGRNTNGRPSPNQQKSHSQPNQQNQSSQQNNRPNSAPSKASSVPSSGPNNTNNNPQNKVASSRPDNNNEKPKNR